MKLNFSEIMENIRRFLVWFLIALAICRNLKCEENVAGDLSGAQSYGIESSIDYTQLDCEYNMDTGDKICDCRNRNEVKITFWHFDFNKLMPWPLFADIRTTIDKRKCQQYYCGKLQHFDSKKSYIRSRWLHRSHPIQKYQTVDTGK